FRSDDGRPGVWSELHGISDAGAGHCASAGQRHAWLVWRGEAEGNSFGLEKDVRRNFLLPDAKHASGDMGNGPGGKSNEMELIDCDGLRGVGRVSGSTIQYGGADGCGRRDSRS